MKKKVLIDITWTLPGHGVHGNYVSGIGQSTMAYLDKLNSYDDLPFDVELYASTSRAKQCEFNRWNYKHHTLPIPSKITNQGWRIEAYLRNFLYKADLFHVTGNYADVTAKEPFIATINDCIELDKINPNNMTRSEGLLKDRLNRMAKFSRYVVTISRFSKSEILRYFDINPDKILVNYCGIDRSRFRCMSSGEIEAVIMKHGIRQPYFFSCSCSHPRKNLDTALLAFREFLTSHHEHIFVAAWGNPTQAILKEFSSEILSGKIVFLPFLTDEEIVALYNGASMSVYVSRKEGFGMPILESFACETPIMTCRNSSLQEVGQDAAIYVGEDNIDEMVDVMKMFESNSYNMDTFKARSKKVLDQFTWENTAKRYLEIYYKSLE